MSIGVMRRRGAMTGLVLLTGTGAGGAAQGAVNDNFNDNAVGSQWTLLADDPSTLDLVEQNQRLELIASSPVSSATDALYLSNGPAGFRLSTAHDFTITVDYVFDQYTAPGALDQAMALVFGVGRDQDGTDSAAVGMGWGTIPVPIVGQLTGPAALVAYRIDDVETNAVQLPTLSDATLPPLAGTFEISYDAADDDLTLGIQAFAISYTLVDTVRGAWDADSLLVSLGARGNGFSTVTGDAWLDNFTVVAGQTVIPEPATATLLTIAAAALTTRPRRSI